MAGLPQSKAPRRSSGSAPGCWSKPRLPRRPLRSARRAMPRRAACPRSQDEYPLFAPVRCGGNGRTLSCLPVASPGPLPHRSHDRQRMGRNRPGRGLSFGGDNAYLKPAGYAVQLHGAQNRTSLLVGRDHFRAQPVGKGATPTIFGQMETHCRAGNRPARFVCHRHRERACGASVRRTRGRARSAAQSGLNSGSTAALDAAMTPSSPARL